MGCNCGKGRAARIAAAAQEKLATQTANAQPTPADMGNDSTTTKETS